MTQIKWEHKGLVCLATDSYGYWRCYVGISKNHPAHGIDYQNINIDVHGGLEWSKNRPGEWDGDECDSDDKWWFGFSTFHGWPTKEERDREKNMSKEDIIKEGNKLAEQLAKLARTQ